METIYVFIIGVLVGAVAVYLITRPPFDKLRAGKSAKKMMEEVEKIKAGHKQKILEMLNGRDKVTNREVEEALDVADASATRYLDELEKEGKVKQVGTDGPNVFYRKA